MIKKGNSIAGPAVLRIKTPLALYKIAFVFLYYSCLKS